MPEDEMIMRSILYPFAVGGKWFSGRITEYYRAGKESSREMKPSNFNIQSTKVITNELD